MRRLVPLFRWQPCPRRQRRILSRLIRLVAKSGRVGLSDCNECTKMRAKGEHDFRPQDNAFQWRSPDLFIGHGDNPRQEPCKKHLVGAKAVADDLSRFLVCEGPDHTELIVCEAEELDLSD